MGWISVGRPGLLGRGRARTHSELNSRFGTGRWRMRHLIDGQSMEVEEAAAFVEAAYLTHLLEQPRVLDRLLYQAADVYENSRTNVRSGLDYSLQERRDVHVYDIAIRRVLKALAREFSGYQLLRIAGRSCQFAPLNPATLPFHRPELIVEPALTGWWQPGSLECFWRSNKIVEAMVDKA